MSTFDTRTSLMIAVTVSVMSATQLVAHSEEVPAKFQQTYDLDVARYEAAQAEARAALQEHEALKQRAEEGVNAKDAQTAANNRQGVEIMAQMIAGDKARLAAVEKNFLKLKSHYQRCKETYSQAQRQIQSTRAALAVMQKTGESSAADIEEWEEEAKDAARDARDSVIEAVKSGAMAKLGKVLDGEILKVGDPKRVKELQRVKRAIDQIIATTHNEVDSMGNVLRDSNAKTKMDMFITLLGDPVVKDMLESALEVTSDVSLAGTIAKSSIDVALQGARVKVSWDRVQQLNDNSGQYLDAVNALKADMEKRVLQLQNATENICGTGEPIA